MNTITIKHLTEVTDQSQLTSGDDYGEENGTESSSSSGRVVTSVPYPAANKLKISDLFKNKKPKNKSAIKVLKKHFYKEGLLEEELAIKIVEDATKIFRSEKNVVEIGEPCVMVGDIHGQFYDLLQILKHGGDLEKVNFIFLGDYVDRGQFSCEVVLLLWFIKLLYPKSIILLRGNHECRHLSEFFTFKRECLLKYTERFYEACITSFLALPIAAVVNKKLFCVHAGLSPEIHTIEEVNKIKRENETPSIGPLCDLLWSDPMPDFNDPEQTRSMFNPNKLRGCSYSFSYLAVMKFLTRTKLLCIIRGHEAQNEGYLFYKSLKKCEFPSLISIFSAPNYCDVYGNKGAIIIYEKNCLNIKQFSAVPHPYWLPNFMDVFTWSMPFIAEKVTEIFQILLNKLETEDRREIIRTKILAIGRISLSFSRARAKREDELALKGLSNPTSTKIIPKVSKIPRLLPLRFRTSELTIDEVKRLDEKNEAFPLLDVDPSLRKDEFSLDDLKLTKVLRRHSIEDLSLKKSYSTSQLESISSILNNEL